MGTGSAGSHFPSHAGHPAAKTTITFRSAAEMLDVFGTQQSGSQYRRLIAAFQRVFGATIFFGADTQAAKATVAHQARFNFMHEARIWYSRDPNQPLLPGGFENVIVLTDEFYREVTAHSIPTYLEHQLGRKFVQRSARAFGRLSLPAH